MHFELVLFWVTRGARDPVDLLRRLQGRVRQFHVKDMNQNGSFEDPGQGLIDFPRIFATHQVEEYIVERDDAGSPPRTPGQALHAPGPATSSSAPYASDAPEPGPTGSSS